MILNSNDYKIGRQQVSRSVAPPGETHLEDHIRTGDIVLVRPMEEIKKTLDDKMQTAGVEFMPGMDRFCGQKATVVKPITYIFDERAWRLLKCKDLFILDGIICEGAGMYEKEGCQRGCHYFWKSVWLRKISTDVREKLTQEESVAQPETLDDGGGCQFKGVCEAIDIISKELNIFDRGWLLFLRLKSALRRRAQRLTRFLPEAVPGSTGIINRSGIPSVKILPYTEIVKRLDPDGTTEGVKFVPAMQPFCGTTRRGLKPVKYFFDERAWKMRKLKNVFLFEDCICSGQEIFYEKDCDRGCFFYWHESWLDKDGSASVDELREADGKTGSD